jgi:hypothetical protein
MTDTCTSAPNTVVLASGDVDDSIAHTKNPDLRGRSCDRRANGFIGVCRPQRADVDMDEKRLPARREASLNRSCRGGSRPVRFRAPDRS